MPTYYGIEDDRFWPAILLHYIFPLPYEESLPKDLNRMRSIYIYIFKYDHYLYIKAWSFLEKKGGRLGKKNKAKQRLCPQNQVGLEITVLKSRIVGNCTSLKRKNKM